MKRPRKAVLLAAGYGARLLPLTLCRPKPLCPVWGKPAMFHALERLREWGVRDVLINVHCHAGKIVDYLRRHPVAGLRCQISFEPEILGTGGALPRARWFLDDDPFWMLNADVLADVPCRPLLDAFAARPVLAALWLVPGRGPCTVETERGLVTTFRSAMPGAPGTATFSGLHLLSPRILRFLSGTGEESIVTAYERAMRAGEPIAGVTVPDAYWADIGTPESYLQAHREIVARAARHEPGKALYAGPPLPRGVPPRSFRSVGRRADIAPSARLVDTVVWDDVTLGPNSVVTNAVVADGVCLRGRASYLALRADTLEDPDLIRLLRRLDWSPARTVLLPLPPRGSARTFTRIQSGPRRAMIVRYSLERAENGLYVRHARFLARQGLRVPAVILDDPAARVTVLEDAGTTSLEGLVPACSRRRVLGLYRAVLNDVIRLHGQATRAARRQRLPLSPPFDAALYEWEQNLFCTQFLVPHTGIRGPALASVRAELAALVAPLLRAPRALLHRDLQSSNVLIKGGAPVLIDFQGMRFGAAAYDLASLLCDPYVNLPATVQAELLDYYASRAAGGAAAQQLFWTAAVERLCQALGAYGRLGANPATATFLRYVPPGVDQLLAALAHVGTLPVLRRHLEAWRAASGGTAASR